jgi:predicted trehalose synthase
MPEMSEGERVQRAIRAATDVARRLGASAVEPVILRHSSNVSIRLAPLRVVARVCTVGPPELAHAKLARDLAVARHLAGKGAPIVPPTTELPPGPYSCADAALTLWRFVDHRPAGEDADDVRAAADALRIVHDALADFPAELPAFGSKGDEVRALLTVRSAVPALPRADRAFLVAVHERVAARVAARPMRSVPIHGDAHLGNVLITAEGARWTDFESACRGPREWDIGFLPDADLSAFGSVDRDLFDALSDLRSLCVAVWCFAEYDDPEKREAADYHLGWLKGRAAGGFR